MMTPNSFNELEIAKRVRLLIYHISLKGESETRLLINSYDIESVGIINLYLDSPEYESLDLSNSIKESIEYCLKDVTIKHVKDEIHTVIQDL